MRLFEVFGGLVTQMAASDLPIGASPACSDVSFLPGKVFTRPGLASIFAAIAGNYTVNYLKTYITPNELIRTLVLDSGGEIWREDASAAPGVLGAVAIQAGTIIANAYAASTTLFGREWIAFSNGTVGLDIPLQWNDLTLDRVSQDGPAVAPTVTDISASLVTISRSVGVISGSISAPAGLSAGSLINIAGMEDTTFNGQWPIATVGGGGTSFTAWGAPGIYTVSVLTRTGNVVTAILASTPFLSAGQQLIVADAGDTSFNGLFTAVSVDGQTVTWNQVAADAQTFIGTFYTQTITLPVLGAFSPINNDGIYEIVFYLATGQINPFAVNSQVTLAGNSFGGWNGTYTVIGLNPRGTPVPGTFAVQVAPGVNNEGFGGTLTLTIPDNLAPTVSGVAGLAGLIPAGVHQVSAMFLTRSGLLTFPAAPFQWYAQGGFQAAVAGIATGPPNVIARYLCFTLANGGQFYTLSDGVTNVPNSLMILHDNTATTATVNFSDAILAQGTNVDDQFDLIAIPETAKFDNYSQRVVAIGGKQKLTNLVNMAFDGGDNAGAPLGWDVAVATGLGVSYVTTVWGGSYQATGNGATATIAQITQTAYRDINKVAILSPNTAYSVSYRARYSGTTPLQGSFVVEVFSPSAGSLGTFTVAATTLGTEWDAYSGTLLTTQTTIPTDTLLRVYVNGTLTNGSIVRVDEMELFETNQAYSAATAILSYAGQGESFNEVTGIVQVNPFDGQAIRSTFKLRGYLHFVKERSLYQVKDDATNEPSLWPVEQVSEKVGTPSLNGVGYGEDWVAIASRDGLYLFWGPEPEKVSQEIQPVWDSINWKYGYNIWVTVDIRKKRILVGVPIGESSFPNKILMLDYSALSSAAEIVEAASIHSSSYTGKNFCIDKARKWAPWTVSSRCGALIERQTGLAESWIGNGAHNGKVYQFNESPGNGGTQTSDDGTQIPSTYTTFLFLEHQLEQQFQIGSHRKQFLYLTMFVAGSGNLGLLAYLDGLGNLTKPLPTLPLYNPPLRTTELVIDLQANRAAFQLTSSGANSWFSLEKFVPTMIRHPWSEVRGSVI